ncbi:MAG: HD domain-containing protein [Gudongella sp.]|nr:HD domain-containing protein [Gudongella sp.]
MYKMGQIIQEMIHYESGVPNRINHFLKVYGFAKAIAEQEGVDSKTQHILEVTAVMHDIGIRISIEKYNSSLGHYQEIEGPPKAREILESYGFDNRFIDRVCFLIAHHHSYDNIEGIDYQILVEVDFLVNIYENKMEKDQINAIKSKIFKTKTGQDYLERMFLQ